MALYRLKPFFYSSVVALCILPATVLASENPITITFLGVSVKERAERAINFLLGIAAALALLLLVINGVRMIASNGDPEAKNKAQKGILGALAGLILIVLSYTFINLTEELLVE